MPTDEEKVIERVARALDPVAFADPAEDEDFDKSLCWAGRQRAALKSAEAAINTLAPGDSLTCQGVRCRVVPEEPIEAQREALLHCEHWREPAADEAMIDPDKAYHVLLQALSPKDADDGR